MTSKKPMTTALTVTLAISSAGLLSTLTCHSRIAIPFWAFAFQSPIHLLRSESLIGAHPLCRMISESKMKQRHANKLFALPNQTHKPTDPSQLDKHTKQPSHNCPKCSAQCFIVRAIVLLSFPPIDSEVTSHERSQNAEQRRT